MTGMLRTVVATMLVAGAAFAHESMDAGRPGRAADITRTISVTADDTGFSVKTIDVHPGETVRFVVTDIDKIDHEFSVATHREHKRVPWQSMPLGI